MSRQEFSLGERQKIRPGFIRELITLSWETGWAQEKVSVKKSSWLLFNCKFFELFCLKRKLILLLGTWEGLIRMLQLVVRSQMMNCSQQVGPFNKGVTADSGTWPCFPQRQNDRARFSCYVFTKEFNTIKLILGKWNFEYWFTLAA